MDIVLFMMSMNLFPTRVIGPDCAVFSQTASLREPALRVESTAPQTMSLSPSSNVSSPMSARMRFNHVSSTSRTLSSLIPQRPPFEQEGSSQAGLMPCLNKLMSPFIRAEGPLMLLYKHQKSSTVCNVWTMVLLFAHCSL